MISPLLLRSSLWVSFRVIRPSVARVRRRNFASQKGFAEARRQSAGSLGWQDAEQRTPGRHPGKRLLEDANREVALPQIAHREREERTIRGEIGAEQCPAGLDPQDPQNILKEDGRDVQRGNRVAHEWQRRRQALERFGITGNREMTRPAARSGPQLRQVHGKPLLQFTGPARSNKSWPWRPATDVDQQAGAIRLRPRAGKRRSSGPRATHGTHRRDQNDAPLHRPAGLA